MKADFTPLDESLTTNQRLDALVSEVVKLKKRVERLEGTKPQPSRDRDSALMAAIARAAAEPGPKE